MGLVDMCFASLVEIDWVLSLALRLDRQTFYENLFFEPMGLQNNLLKPLSCNFFNKFSTSLLWYDNVYTYWYKNWTNLNPVVGNPKGLFVIM